jgi:phenylalanyl-tRNA synthetase beta chain
MKIAYCHLIKHIHEKPRIDELSDRLFQLGHEHEVANDIFEIEFTPNRGDCLSINGLLRDLAVFYTIEFNNDIYEENLKPLALNFKNLAPQICPKISFLMLEIESVPDSYKGVLKDYFSDLNLNKNNFFTDVSNYLSYEMGQPTHCYDREKIEGEIVFQESKKDIEFKTLLGKKINLTKKNAIFSCNDKPINLAGVIGGKNTECSSGTKNILVECAFFEPDAIIGKTVKYDIQSEAAHKFERGVDPDCHEKVLRRFIQIVDDHAQVNNIEFISNIYTKKTKTLIPFDVTRINKIIGIEISINNFQDYLLKLGFRVIDDFIEIPSYRSDIKTQNDLAEEVARIIGYDNIPVSSFSISRNIKKTNVNIENKIKSFLLDHGFFEVINAPFVDVTTSNCIKVDNPLDSSKKFLRTSLIGSLINNLLYNEKRQKESIKLFEFSDVYYFDKKILKKRKLAIIASGRVGLNYEDFSLKINKKYMINLFKKILPDEIFDFETISRENLDTKIKSEIVSLEIDIKKISDEVLKYNEMSKPPTEFKVYESISELPLSYKDISFSVKDYTKLSELENFILNYKDKILKNIFIFDYYKNEEKNEIKIGFRFTFQSQHETLNSNQIEKVLDNIVKKSLKIKSITIPGM